MNARRFGPILLVFPLILGCGGLGHPSSTTLVGKGKGRATLRIKWPARSNARMIPNAANAITVGLTLDGKTVATKTIPRPVDGTATTSTDFAGLAYGTYAVAAQAFPNADGSGVVQAAGGGAMTVTEDVPGALAVAMDSTVASLKVEAPATLGVGGAATATVTALDASGAVVLLSAGGGAESLAWASDAPGVATVAGDGPTVALTGVAGGCAHVTAALRMDDAGDVVTARATVSVPIVLKISDGRSLIATLTSPISLSLSGQALVDGGIAYQYSPTIAQSRLEWRALFPLGSVPPNATVVSAVFGAERTYTIYNNLSHSLSSYSSSSGTVGLTIDGALYGPWNVTDALGLKTIDVTSSLKDMLASGSPFAGFRMVPPGPPNATRVGTASWGSPTLTITYTTP